MNSGQNSLLASQVKNKSRITDCLSLKGGLIPLFFVIIFFQCCRESNDKRDIERAFYFWKSVYKIPATEEKIMDSLRVNTIYVKYFDVDWDNTLNQPVPKASLRVNEKHQGGRKIIPCIFITNQCILKTTVSQVPQLAINILKLVGEINNQLGVKNEELQFDCDWTATTSATYFNLLKSIRQQMRSDSTTSNAILSATIRLYQVKYLNKTGVPPVDRGLLMAYNMGNLRDPATNNSILEAAELKKYISYLSAYPLELDVALPVFEWTVLFRDNRFAGLIEEAPKEIFSQTLSQNVASNKFKVLTDTTLNGYEFKKDDVLRVEPSRLDEILEAASAIDDKLRIRRLRLALFHLDSLTLSKYKLHELETIFSSLN